MTIFNHKHSSSLLTSTFRSVGVSALIALSSSMIVGCESPDYSAGDSLPNYNFNIAGDSISGLYLTESRITFNINRNLEDDHVADLSITSSDTMLLRPISGEAESASEPGRFQQSFDVLAEGMVTVTFKDGDDSVLSREIELVNATTIIPKRTMYTDLLRVLSETAEDSNEGERSVDGLVGNGEKVIVGGHYHLVFEAYRGEGEEQALVNFDTYTQQPQSEQAEVTTSGREITITPQQEGDAWVNVQLGGQTQELRLQGVSEDAIVSLSVEMGDTHPNAQGTEEAEGYAIITTKDEDDGRIYGARITWSRLAEDGETELNEILEGELVTFERSETERVAFKVQAGSQSTIVELPMKRTSEIFTSNDEPLSCDAQAGFAGQIPLSILLMVIFVIRRQQGRVAA